jgi:putative membrane protein
VRADLEREGGWQRLHPLSPVTRIGRLAPVIGLTVFLSVVHQQGDDQSQVYIPIAIAVLTVILGGVNWLVTRWKVEGDTLRIETGLIRRDSKRLPLARIQAVDVVRPLLARLLGVAELRIRLAGSGSTDGRLSYLSEATAFELRLRLLGQEARPAAAPSGDADPPAPPEHVMASVDTGRLLGSVALSGITLVLVLVAVALAVLAVVAPRAAAGVGGFLFIYVLRFAGGLWRRLSNEFHFEAVEAPEGIRIRRGLLQTVSETIPYGRIQAIRQVEPLLWRPMRWCRLEVDIAGGARKSARGEGSGVARKALLPVGSHPDAWHLLDRLIGGVAPTMSAPPQRARRKAPLSYHYLSAGHDEVHAVCVTGRLRRVTTWVPLEKAQSIRRVQGPVQRRLGLATVHLDAAGKATRAEFRDRDITDADHLVEELTQLSRAARQERARPPVETSPDVGAAIPSGWYPDPSGRYEQRYWRAGAWTDHVVDGGVTTTDDHNDGAGTVDNRSFDDR